MANWNEKYSRPVLFTALGMLLIFVTYVGFFSRQKVTESKFESLPKEKQETLQKRAAELGENEDYLKGTTIFQVK